jgi:hypothetical protein
MIELKTLVDNLQEKLNKNIQGFDFALSLDTAKFKRSLRRQNTVRERINGLVRVMSSDTTNLSDGKLFSTLSCRVNFIFKLEGKEEDEIVYNEKGEVSQVIQGYKTKIDNVRLALSTAFQRHEQETMTEKYTENGETIEKEFLVIKLYQFPESGERTQVQELGDSYSFSVYISYMFVEGGISTYDVKYTLDGVLIPFQTITTYRTPTMDGNVYADTKDGATKNLVSQTSFSVSFILPALKNPVTRNIFKYIFGGKINEAHLLNIKYPSFDGGEAEEYNYLVTLGESYLSGDTILNIGQTITLLEAVDDYELLSFPDKLYVYQLNVVEPDVDLVFNEDAYFYNFETKSFGFAKKDQIVNVVFSGSNHIVCTSSLKDISNFGVLQNGR